VSPALGRQSRWRVAFVAGGSVGVALVAMAFLFPQPLRRLVAPPPVEGLPARVSLDGRLLGHFPYEQAEPADLVTLASGLTLHRDAASALEEMQRDALFDGIDLRVVSAYRSIDLQKQIFFGVKSERNQSAAERARVSAPPGFSEHSTGYAVDLGDGDQPATHLSISFETTRAFAWLKANANRYHFTLSFPEQNSQGVSYEPWHWRFEGSAQALQTFEAAQRVQN
jgi:D-alanyl-D-alanine carboxypeptidase